MPRLAPDPDVVTPRLLLRLLGRATVAACMAGDAATAAQALGVPIPAELLSPSSGLRYTADALDHDPGYLPWSTRAILLRQPATLVGYVRFHERPDPSRPHPFGGHAAELGYAVFPAHRRQGYAREAAAAMMHHAQVAHDVHRFVASIGPDNTPSLRLAATLGFTRVGEQIDPIDGLEHVFLRVAPSPRAAGP